MIKNISVYTATTNKSFTPYNPNEFYTVSNNSNYIIALKI